jgi:hypothetical protein
LNGQTVFRSPNIQNEAIKGSHVVTPYSEYSILPTTRHWRPTRRSLAITGKGALLFLKVFLIVTANSVGWSVCLMDRILNDARSRMAGARFETSGVRVAVQGLRIALLFHPTASIAGRDPSGCESMPTPGFAVPPARLEPNGLRSLPSNSRLIRQCRAAQKTPGVFLRLAPSACAPPTPQSPAGLPFPPHSGFQNSATAVRA